MATQTLTIQLAAIPLHEGDNAALGLGTSDRPEEETNEVNAGRTLGATDTHQSTDVQPMVLRPGRATLVVIQLASLNFITSFTHGLLTVGVPAIASALHLDESLYAWPISVFSLACGSCLLLAGSISDVLGARTCNLVGAFSLSAFILACGFSQTGVQLVVLRAMQGLASALAVPSSVSIVSTLVQSGRPRNIAFATLGFARDLGFSVGLVLGGIFIASIGWRAAFYIAGSFSFLLFVIGSWTLPKPSRAASSRWEWQRLTKEVDWIVSASGSLALLSYVLAVVSSKSSNIKHPSNISMMAISTVLAACFIYWQGHQEKRRKPALIPNSLWRRTAFSTACATVLIAMAVVPSIELFSSLFFQQVQHLSALQASIRILPNVVAGVAFGVVTGLFIDSVPPVHAAAISTTLCAIAPLLMALINPHQTYWYNAFWAQALTPISIGVLFTLGTLICSSSFAPHTQALAGAVFNTMSQIGTSIGLTLASVVASSVTETSHFEDKLSAQALMEGYRATFWLLFGLMLLTSLVGVVGLRKLGRVGQKSD